MNKHTPNFRIAKEWLARSFYIHFFLLLFFTLYGRPTDVHAQNYIGVGLHLTPPVFLQYTENAYVTASPRVGMGFSVTCKKEWTLNQNKKWYAEAGVTTQGLRYYQVDYFGDSLSIWSDFQNEHIGFPAILLGGGYSFAIGKSKNEFSLGAEGSLILVQDLGEIESNNFGIIHHPVRDAPFPLFLRFNLAYNRRLHFFRRIPAHLQFYTNLSFQKMTKGTQYIRNKLDGTYLEGAYSVNNSELGVKLFTCLDKKARSAPVRGTTPENALLAGTERKLKFRISLAGQFFTPRRTIYHIPRVDSFSVRGGTFRINSQFSVLLEFPFHKNDLWGAVVGLGIGERAATLVFKSDGQFSSDQLPVEYESQIFIGHYAMSSVGLSRRYAAKRLSIGHTLSVTAMLPIEKENTLLSVPLSSTSQPMPVDNPILEGRVDYEYGREKILLGVEYTPEIYFKLPRQWFISLGLVANFTNGVMAQGQFKVLNDRTTYYGALLQKFSKLGMTLRVGFEK